MSATVETSVAIPRSAGSRWALTVLVAVAIFINYIDRGNLATAAPLIKSDLHLTNLQIGLLTSAFFAAYVPAQIAAAGRSIGSAASSGSRSVLRSGRSPRHSPALRADL